MPRAHDIAPQVTLYPCGSAPPPLKNGRIALAHIPPGTGQPVVFGDGSHPTTRLCAAALDFLCRQRQPEAVLDVGTGTGVLARIARARGARLVAGTDIDPAALASARTHAALDTHPVEIHLGSEPPDHWGERFDLVIANILEAPLRALAPALARSLVPGGWLLLSGFTPMQIPALRLEYERAGLSFARESRLGDWALLAFSRRAKPVEQGELKAG
jgi:ribosomal protein L11 methyltransferase